MPLLMGEHYDEVYIFSLTVLKKSSGKRGRVISA